MTPLTMTELTLQIQRQIGREDTLRLLKRAGAAARASKNEFAPIHILLLLKKRLDEQETIERLVLIPNGKLIKLTRSYFKTLANSPQH